METIPRRSPRCFPPASLLTEWFAKWRGEANPANRLADMRAANPILIPRNHRVEQAIQSGYAGDFAPFHRLVDALAAPYTEQPEYADLEAPRAQKKSSIKPSAALRRAGSQAPLLIWRQVPRSRQAGWWQIQYSRIEVARCPKSESAGWVLGMRERRHCPPQLSLGGQRSTNTCRPGEAGLSSAA